MHKQSYPRAWRWDTDGDRLESRFVRIEQGVAAPKRGKVADVLVLDVKGIERSLWLWTVALKGFAARIHLGGASTSATIALEHQGTTTHDQKQGPYRRDYSFSVNREVVAV